MTNPQDFQDGVYDAHNAILSKLEQLRDAVNNFEDMLDLTAIKPIPVQMIKSLMEIREVLKLYARGQLNEVSKCDFDFVLYMQQLGSVIDYLHKYNKKIYRVYANETPDN